MKIMRLLRRMLCILLVMTGEGMLRCFVIAKERKRLSQSHNRNSNAILRFAQNDPVFGFRHCGLVPQSHNCYSRRRSRGQEVRLFSFIAI